MLRTLLGTTVTAFALLSAAGATTASAAETGQGYAPSATVTVAPPAYAPPPTYQPPPPPPSYGPPPPPPGQYASAQYQAPPPRYGGSNRYAADFEIARPGWSISAMLGFGFNSVYDFGLGIRGGYTLPQHIYIGGEFTYFFGGGEGVYNYSTFNIGPEIGYDIGLAAAPILIRPYAGLGYDRLSISNGVNCGGNDFCAASTGSFALWAGAMSTWNFTRNWSAGVDLRLIIPVGLAPANDPNAPGFVALTLMGMGSYKF